MRLTTADRLADCRALCRVVASRISWLAILQRRCATASAPVVFADTELRRPEHTLPSSRTPAPRDLKVFVTAVARPGDHVDKSQDAPPATTVIQRRIKRRKAPAEVLGTASTSDKAKLAGNRKAKTALASEQATWHGKTGDNKDLVHHSDRRSQHLSIKHTERMAEAGIDLSVETVGGAEGNALAEYVVHSGAYAAPLGPRSPSNLQKRSDQPDRPMEIDARS